jgi:hypothetical protein
MAPPLNPNAAHDEKILSRYATLMEEIKRRYSIIDKVLIGPFTMDPRTAEEFCLLHLRMICELIAIGCLVVNGDIKETRSGKITGLYQADAIIKALGHLHPDFYPRPGKEFVYSDGKVEILGVETGFLTKSELVRLYHKCGEVLHIGSLKRLPVNWNRTVDLQAIRVWCTKIITLLNHHRITLVRKDYEIWTQMQANPDGKVRSYVFKKIGLAPPR